MRKLLPAFLLLLTLTACGRRKKEEEISLSIVDPAPVTQTAATIPAETTEPETQPKSSVITEPTKRSGPSLTETAAPESETPEETEAVTSYETELQTSEETVTAEATLDKDGYYYTKDDVALYIYTYGELPKNFITKKQAEKLGWSGGSLEPYAPGCAIGGSRFGNYEGLLPDAPGRTYTECDIDTKGKKSRGAKRIVFSNDGLIYYTGDHYESFELLYGEVS